MRAGVENEVADAQAVATPDLVGERFHGLAAQRPERRSEVDQVGGVPRHVGESGAARRSPEGARLRFLDLLSDPAVVVLDEDLDDPASRGHSALHGPRRPSRDGLMRPDQQILGGHHFGWHQRDST